jgi:hypothetical protein
VIFDGMGFFVHFISFLLTKISCFRHAQAVLCDSYFSSRPLTVLP